MFSIIPEEHTFLFSDAIPDKQIINRLWFNLPPTWETSYKLEPMIGIRNMFVPKTYRIFDFTCNLEMYEIVEGKVADKPINTLEFRVQSWMDRTKDLRQLYKDVKDYLVKAINKNSEKFPDLPKFERENLRMDFVYGKDNSGNNCYIERFFPNSHEPEKYEIRLGLSKFNDDFRYIFNIADKDSSGKYIIEEYPITKEPILFYHVWDRHSCNVCASFVLENNQLGYLNQKYNPLKYYKLNSSSNKIWFEFYNNCEPIIPIIFPKDGRDGLNIECTFLDRPPKDIILN